MGFLFAPNPNLPKQLSQITAETQAFWQQYTGEPMPQTDAEQAVANVAGFIRLLAEWEEKAGSGDDASKRQDEGDSTNGSAHIT